MKTSSATDSAMFDREFRPSSAPEPGLPYSEASRLALLRDTQALIDRLSARVQKDRNAFDDYIMLGRLFRIRSDPKRALRLHRNLLVKTDLTRDHQIRLYVELGFDLLDLKVQDFGVSYFERALDLQRSNVAALEGLARAHEFQAEFELAAQALVKLLHLGRPEERHLAFIYTALSRKYLDRGLTAKARRAVHRALKADADNLYAQVTLADVYLEGGKPAKALGELKDILFRRPSHSFLILRRMEDAHYRLNTFTEFENTLAECLRASPDNFYAHYSLARHLRKKRRFADAVSSLRTSLEINPFYVNSFRDRIEMTADGGEMAEVRRLSKAFFAILKESRRFICPNCRHRFPDITWYCNVCGTWNTFEIRYELKAP